MSKKPLKIIAGAPDRPLAIGDIEIPCYVLEDKTRVLSQRGFLKSIGKTEKARGASDANSGADNPPPFLSANNLKSFIINEVTAPTTPILFQPITGRTAYGYKAELLPQVCSVYMAARAADALLPSQMHIAEKCDILIRGLATVGIIALVDEATGYQEIRAKRALATILETFLADEVQKWTKTFPLGFYEEIFRLRKWPWPAGAENKKPYTPQVIGHYTNDIVYDRLAPGVLQELKERNPKKQTGKRQHRHHQWFNPDLGHPRLKEHLAAVTALMRAAPNWDVFQRNLQRAFPKRGTTLPIPNDIE